MTTQTPTRFRLGPPQISGPLAVYPIFGETPTFRYASLRSAVKHGLSVSELEAGASVNDVSVKNLSGEPVLLYEGELITGAQQNRTIDQPVLVPAHAQLTVPVCCVEHGRWDHRRHRQDFAVSPRMSDPGLRGLKRRSANARVAAGAPARPDQGEVWNYVGAGLAAHSVPSPSQAFTDLYEAKADTLGEIGSGIVASEGQIGAVAEVHGRPVAFDLVSREEVFADLFSGLIDGYALGALNALKVSGVARAKASESAAQDFFDLVLDSRTRWLPTPGMGDAFVPTRRRINGSGLRAEGELIALSAFPAS